MKFKSLSFLVLTLLVSTSSMAIEISHGKLLRHTEYTQGKAKLLNQTPGENKKLSQYFMNTVNKKTEEENIDQILTLNNIDGIQFEGNNTIISTGSSEILIKNHTSTHTYGVETKLCLVNINDSTNDQNCVIVSDNLGLDYSGNIQGQYKPKLTMAIDHPGDYVVYIASTITRDNTDVIYTSASNKFFQISAESFNK